MGRVLAEHAFVRDIHVEHSAVAVHERDIEAAGERSLELCHQTGGAGQVVSANAVRDADIHAHRSLRDCGKAKTALITTLRPTVGSLVIDQACRANGRAAQRPAKTSTGVPMWRFAARKRASRVRPARREQVDVIDRTTTSHMLGLRTAHPRGEATMEIVSVGPTKGGPEGLRRELRAVADSIEGDRLALLYLPIDLDHRAYLAAAAEGLGAPVVGASTAGAAFTERGFTETEPVAAVLSGRDLGFAVAVAHDLSRDPVRQIQRAARQLVDASHPYLTRAPVLLTFADGFSCGGEALWTALNSAVPAHWRIIGGAAGDDWRFNGSVVFAGQEILHDAAVLVGLFTDARASLVVQHGWRPVDGGHEMTITDIEGQILRALDGRPAATAYRAELTRLGLMREPDDLLGALATYPLGTETLYGRELRIRAPIGMRDDGSIVLASGLPCGTRVRVVAASSQELINAARQLADRALEPFEGSAVRGALVFDCGARKRLLGDRYAEQVSAFLGGRRFPMAGMTCYGEIAKFAGSVDGFHNATAAMSVW